MAKLKDDLTGQRFGKLLVVKFIETDQFGTAKYLCKCDCGFEKNISRKLLKSGEANSCGCYNIESHTKHGLSGTPIYKVWRHMISRCYNPKDCAYERYGKKGITVCDAWKHDIQQFYHWAIRSGYKSGLTIDRIDNDKGYNPANCRWATDKQQANNRSSNHMITYNGETHTIMEWSEMIGIDRSTLWARINKLGWSPEKALTTPIDKRKSWGKRP